MRALDTSVVLPAPAAYHDGHAAVVAELTDADRLPEHVVLESYFVLTRLPAPLRFPAPEAARVLAQRFPPPYLSPGEDLRASLVLRCAEAGVFGGAVYDGLIALTAASHGTTLLTRDNRAVPTYRRLGAKHQQIR